MGYKGVGGTGCSRGVADGLYFIDGGWVGVDGVCFTIFLDLLKGVQSDIHISCFLEELRGNSVVRNNGLQDIHVLASFENLGQ